MLAGHAFLAFTLVTVGARLLGADVRRALVLGATAGTFAAIPDVDMIYAWKEIASISGAGLAGFVEAFWAASRVTHRGVSHSLVTAAVSAAAFSFQYTDRKLGAYALFAVLLAGAAFFGGVLTLFIMALFIGAGYLLTGFVRRNSGMHGEEFFPAVLAGLASHPFGDVFTGQPPSFLFPFDVSLLAGRVVLHADPVVNLLLVFLLEIGTVAAGLLLFLRLTGRPVREQVHPVAALGLLYGAAVFVVPAPTLKVSYQFVYSILALGAVGGAGVAVATGTSPSMFLRDAREMYRDPVGGGNWRLLKVVTTGVATVIIGYSAYVVGYLLL